MARIVSLGLHIADMLGRPVTVIPKGQDLNILQEIRLTVAGTAAGTSVDLAKLGAEVAAMGAIGADELGNFIVSTMNRYGIDTSCLVRKAGVQTSATILPIRPNGERPALHVPGANAELSLEDINWEAIKSAQFLHIGGTYLMPKFDGEPAATVLAFAKQHGVITTMDLIGPRPNSIEVLKPCLPYIDYFMPNIDEARTITGLTKRQELIKFFLDQGAGHTVLKMGSEGSSIASREGEMRLPAYKVNVVDTTGCGDAYSAGFIVGLSLGWELEQAGRLGAACGSLVATGLGSDAGIVDLEQTISFMKAHATLPMTE